MFFVVDTCYGKLQIKDSDDGVMEYGTHDDILKLRKLGYKIMFCEGFSIEFKGGLAFMWRSLGRVAEVRVVHLDSGNVINTGKVNFDFGDNDPPYSYGDSFYISVYPIQGSASIFDIYLQVYYKHYYGEDKDETFEYLMQYDKASNTLTHKSKVWGKV